MSLKQLILHMALIGALSATGEVRQALEPLKPGDNRQEDYNAWGCHWFYNTMLLEYARTGDNAILDAVRRGLLWFVKNRAGERRTIGYMASPNQGYATRTSSRWGPEHFYHAYAPNMNAACCPGGSQLVATEKTATA